MRRAVSAALLLLLPAALALAEENTLQVRFKTGGILPKLHSAVPVTVVLERSTAVSPGEELFVRLRVPVGIRVSGENWKPQPAPAEADPQAEESFWTIFDWNGPIEWKQEPSDRWTAAIPVLLEVTEEGTNWIISAQAQAGPAKASGVVLATIQSGFAAFHSAPFKNPLPVEMYDAPETKKKNAKKNGS